MMPIKFSHRLESLHRHATPSLKPRIRRALRAPAAIRWEVHGRHLDVDDEMREKVIDRLSGLIHMMETPAYIESSGGVSHVDVRLMNTSAEIRIHPVRLNKELHDTYLRQGELYALSTGCEGANACFGLAVQQLERKLKHQQKATPRKVDYRSFGPGSRT